MKFFGDPGMSTKNKNIAFPHNGVRIQTTVRYRFLKWKYSKFINYQSSPMVSRLDVSHNVDAQYHENC